MWRRRRFRRSRRFERRIAVGAVRLNRGAQKTAAEAAAELIAKVRTELGPVAAFKSAAAVARLPKTRSGKVLRATMRKMANGDDYETPPTIDDPAIIPEIAAALKTLGYPKGT